MDPSLERLAKLYGIEPGYHDIWGQWRATSDEAARKILAAMGVDVRDPSAVERLLAAEERAEWARAVPPVTVLRSPELGSGVRIHLLEPSLGRPLAWRLTGEGGEIREEGFNPVKLALLEERSGDGWQSRALALPLPPDLAEGYHRLTILEGDTLLGSGVVAVVPAKCYQPAALAAGSRLWGPAVQLYGVRSRRNAGIGNFGDLRACAEIWGGRGAALVGTNPLHALSLRDPGYGSPYSPSSRLFLNCLYIDVEAVADFSELAARDRAFLDAWRKASEELRALDEVDYHRVSRVLREVFVALYANFREHHLQQSTPRARAFARFRESRGPALARHALHEALCLHFDRPWPQWPAEFREPEGAGARRFREQNPDKVVLHEYLQWQADLQLANAQSRSQAAGMAVGLYADLAVSVAGDGAEAWANQRLYALGVNVGAPPDDFNRDGQDWGLPPLAPRRLRAAAYAPFIATLRANMARAGGLRIDHVMGIERQWWVPHGMKATEGAYVRFPLEDLVGLIALESHRARCIVVGEDLGTVSDALRARLAEAGIYSYRLCMFEREGRAFRAPSRYSPRALVAWSTHDLPTLRGWWLGRDLQVRAKLSHLDTSAFQAAQRERRDARAALVEALAEQGLAPANVDIDAPADDALVEAVHAFLARSPSPLLLVQMEDVLGMEEQANLPGTVDTHPNWRRKLPVPVESWGREERLRRLARRLGEARGRRERRESPPGLGEANIPRATYRLQLHGEFTFRDATRLLPYLAELGVSHVYCSPYLRARPGSKHGYDIVDHDELNPEIGTRTDFEAFVSEMKRLGLKQMMDIVPNHMGVLGADNGWWQDLLENGPASTLADFFDIDWHPPSEHLANRVLLPVLGEAYGAELAAGRLKLEFDTAAGMFAVRYHGHRLPIDPTQYPRILAPALRALEASGEEPHNAQALRSLVEAFARLPRRDETARARMDQRNLDKEIAKGRLARLARSSPAVAAVIGRAIEQVNGRPDDPSSFDELHDLLERQPYRLAYWRVAQDEINYRRFFDINDLAALRQENRAVFDVTHRLIVSLVKAGAVDALRVDHPDGLYDPREYFRRLQEACGKPTYVAVEKIVAPFENLREDWPVHGTTGYRFANVVNGLFVDTAAESRLTRTYAAFIGDATPFAEVARRAKREVLRTALASELTVLASRLARIARADRNTRDFTFTTLREGLTEVIAAFPVYRTYVDDHVDLEDKRYIEWAVNRARADSRAADVGVFDFLRDALTAELPGRSPARAAAIRHFARKFQQLSAPVMAKGVEDTAFYRYNRLVSLNDVGGDPAEFGFPTARFHRASSHRARRWPHTMLATSTHDNKRSEDVRLRIDVISEMAGEWRLRLRRWQRMNAARKVEVDGEPAPSANDEYLLYQILLGSLPIGKATPAHLADYRERIVAYMRKATREAKSRTSWANENAPYERATEGFIRALLDDRHPNAFLDDLRAAVAPVAWVGLLNGLCATAIKLTSPGVPDIYQGTELWDYSLVDPDNRRPVDYERRRALLHEIRSRDEPSEAYARELLESLPDGRAKLYLTWRLLQLRRTREALFRLGGYTALRASGSHARHVVAFARRHGGDSVLTVVPRLVAGLGVRAGGLPHGIEVWADTRVELPMFKDGTELTDVLTGRVARVERGGIALGDLLAAFPVAVLRH